MNKYLVKLSEDISLLSSEIAHKVLLNHERLGLHNPLIHKTNHMLSHINKEFEDKGFSVEDDPIRYRKFLASKVKQHNELFEDYRPRHTVLLQELSSIPHFEIPENLKDSDKVLSNKIDELFL